MRSFKIIFFSLFTFILSSTAQSQTATLRGFVYDKENGEPIIFTNVFLKGTSYGTATDVNGYYSLSKIKPGNYTVMVSYLGYDTLKVPIVLGPEDIISKKLYIKKRSIELTGVDISADKQEAKTEVRVSVTKVTPEDIKQVVSIGGEADIAQYMQTLPGVVSSGDQGGQLYIRGGSPIQNEVLLDGMVIYNPFHSIGLFSVFDNDIIRNADVYTGGFNAEYGGRVSSVMDIKTRDGNKTRLSGKVSASPFMSKVILEGPIVKQSADEDKGSSSFIVSAKKSYLQQTSKSLYSYVSKDGIPYNFTDLYGKVSFNTANGSKLNVFGFNFGDSVLYKSVSNLGWNSRGFGSNFVIVPGSSPVLIDGAVAYSDYNISQTEALQRPRTSSINGTNMGLNFTYFIAKDEIKYGINVNILNTKYNFYTPTNQKVELTGTSTEVVGYGKFKKILNDFLIEPGLHIHYYAKLDEFSIEPRLGMKYNCTDRLRVKFAGGLYSQNLISARSDRDVVNLFYGFLTGPESVADNFGGKTYDSKLQKAWHAITGFEYDLTRNLDLNVEGYIKDFYQLSNINRNKIYEDNAQNNSIPQSLKRDFVIETGIAKGIDVTLKYEFKKLYIWTTYSLSNVTRTSDINGDLIDYPTHYDRRHNFSLVTSYRFGKKESWEVDARWNIGSGFPFTQTQGFYPKLNFADGLSTDVSKSNGDLGIIYADINQGRLPYYQRMDLAIKKKYELSKNSLLEINGSVTNLYNYSNIFYIDRITNEKIYQLPILPSLGASLTF